MQLVAALGHADGVLVVDVLGALGDLGRSHAFKVGVRNAALSWRCLVQPITLVSCTRPMAACRSVMRLLKPTSSFSYWVSMPWLRSRRRLRSTVASEVGHHAALAGGHVLGGVQAEHAELAEGANLLAVDGRTVGLGCVLVQVDAVLVGQRRKGLGGEGVAVEVHRHDALGLLRDQRLNMGHVEGVVVQLNVGEDRGGTGQRHRVAGGGKGERRDNDLVAGAHAAGQQAQVQAGGA